MTVGATRCKVRFITARLLAWHRCIAAVPGALGDRLALGGLDRGSFACCEPLGIGCGLPAVDRRVPRLAVLQHGSCHREPELLAQLVS